MYWLEQKYINLLSFRLQQFKRKSDQLYNFRCPICLDSQKNKLKARGYFYWKKGVGLFHCQNCKKTLSFDKFLKIVDPGIYGDYQLEKLKENSPREQPEQLSWKQPKYRTEGILKNLKTVSQLSPNDPVKKLVVQRKIPNEMHRLLFKCEHFMRFTNEIIPGKFKKESLRHDETRLLIPFLDSEKNCWGYQGRAIGNSEIRYITIVVDDNKPKVWGLDRVDPNKRIFVFEGPIDAMFVDNAIATAGGEMVSTLASLPYNPEHFVICYDNEPHSKHTIEKIQKAIDHNYKVAIYPEHFKYKDINDAIMGDMNQSEVQWILDHSVYSDLHARLQLATYSKT